MIFKYICSGRIAHCDIKLYRNLVIVTESKDNEGMSITNSAEDIANACCDRYNIKPEDLIYIEHYNKDSYTNISGDFVDTYDFVSFEVVASYEFSSMGGRLYNPKWTRITKEYLDNAIAGIIQTEV